MIVIPDVHGRKFWKEAVEEAAQGELVVFLGDYLEPYTSGEGITHEQAYENFLEILEYARTHRDTCRLLLGNHDFACIYPDMVSCRHDFENEERNRAAFTDNFDLFSLTCEAQAGGRKVLFSHAGIHRVWFEKSVFCPADGKYDDADVPRLINEGFARDPEGCIRSLNVYSMFRGLSPEIFGSCVWSDVREWFYGKRSLGRLDARPFPFYQVFGHTQVALPIVTDWMAMLDCRRAFGIDETAGEIGPLFPRPEDADGAWCADPTKTDR